MANIHEIRDGVVTRGRSLLGEATKPVYAWIGAGDVVRSQVVTLPARAQERLNGIRKTLPDSPSAVRTTVEGYAASALTGFAELTQRGERVVETMRHRSADVVEPAVVIDSAVVADKADAVEEATVADNANVADNATVVDSVADANIIEAPIARAAKKATTPRAPKSSTRTAAGPSARRTGTTK